MSTMIIMQASNSVSGSLQIWL